MNPDEQPKISTRALLVHLLGRLDDIERKVDAVRIDNADTRLTCEAPKAGRFRRSVVAVVEWRAIIIAAAAVASEAVPVWLARRK